MEKDVAMKCIKAGKIAAQVRRLGADKLKVPGTSYAKVMDFCEQKIVELGGEVAWAQMAINDVAAHDCPTDETDSNTEEGDLVKIDIGVHLDGWIADNAMSIEVGSGTTDKAKDPLNKDLMKASSNAVKAAGKLVRPGCTLGELGAAQYSEAEKLGFKTIRNLCGHTLEQNKVHAGVSIPSFDNRSKKELEAGWQIAIEPFVTNGEGLVKEKGQSTIFMAKKNAAGRTPYARKIIDFVKPRNGMPFHTRELARKFGNGAAKLGLRELHKNGAITAYPPLAEVSGAKVAQFEHSFLVQDKTVVYTRHDEDEW